MGFFSWMRHVRGCGIVAELVAELFAGLIAELGVVVGVKDVYFVSSGGV